MSEGMNVSHGGWQRLFLALFTQNFDSPSTRNLCEYPELGLKEVVPDHSLFRRMNLVNTLSQIFRLGWRIFTSSYEDRIYTENCMLRRVSLPEFFGALVRIFPRLS
jgi:hypothetical protein